VLAFAAAPNFEAPTDAGGNNVYDVTVEASDGHGGISAPQALAVTVTDVNEAPVITSNGGGDSAAISRGEGTILVTTVTATDEDAGQALTYTIIGGADAAKFTLDYSIDDGAYLLAFAAAPNFEAPTDANQDNVYDVEVQVSDGHGGIDTQSIAVTVTDQNETPIITSNGGGDSGSISVAENTTAVTIVTATDPDTGQTLSYSISGADAALFTIDPATGVLAFAAAPNFEAPTDAGGNNVYDVTVEASDGHGGISAPQALAVTVTDVDETAPTVSTVSYGSNDGTLRAGETVMLLVAFSEAVTLAGGTPTLALNDGGTANYASGSGTNLLTFSYTVLAGQNTSDLAVIAFNLNGATITDPAGNNAITAGAIQNPAGILVVDTTPPVAPTGLDLAAADDSGSSPTDNITKNASALTISGFGENGDTVILFDDANNNGIKNGGEATLGTAIVSGGSFSLDISLTAGTHHVRAFQTDAAGNVSGTSTPLNLTVDTSASAPNGLDLAAADDTGSSNSDNITKNTSSLTISGSGENGATVTLFDDVNNNGIKDVGETSLASATVSGGTFSADVSLSSGIHHILASETDVAGNVSGNSSSLDVTVDTTAPVSALTGEALNNNGKVALTGTTGEANDTISVYDGASLLGTTTTAANGTWAFTTPKISDAVHTYTATATDLAGNTGTGSNAAILGSSSGNSLVGTSGNDLIDGRGGNDTITGGAGADTITGGAGNDKFAYNAVTESQPGANNFDTIIDFAHASDKIDFSAITGITGNATLVSTAGTVAAHGISYYQSGSDTVVIVNATNTANHVDMEIHLTGVAASSLTASDFVHH
jgi:dihydrodipicolinate reductase